MSLEKYRKVKVLGTGSYGTTVVVHLKDDKTQKFAIKEIPFKHMSESEKTANLSEVEVLRQMSHRNIMRYVESFIQDSKFHIVTEYLDGLNLSQVIAKHKNGGTMLEENDLMRIFGQLCLALNHIHEQHILHRNLKPLSVFLTKEKVVKLGGFRTAKVLSGADSDANISIGSPFYMPPESCKNKPYNSACDVWAIGVLLYELMGLDVPFHAVSMLGLVKKICDSEPNWDKIKPSYSESAFSLCQSLLIKDCKARPSVREVLQNQYLLSFIGDLLGKEDIGVSLLNDVTTSENDSASPLMQSMSNEVVESNQTSHSVESTAITTHVPGQKRVHPTSCEQEIEGFLKEDKVEPERSEGAVAVKSSSGCFIL